MSKKLPKSILILSYIFITSLVLAMVIVANIYLDIFSFSQSLAYIYLLVLFAICVNFGFSLLRFFTNFLKKGIVFYLFQWTLTIVLPVLLISLIELSVQKRIMKDVVSKMTPLIEYVDNYKKSHEKYPKEIKKGISKIDNFSYYHDKNSYMIKIVTSRVDMDGETIYFDSRDRHWYRFHQNQYEYFKDKKVIPPNIKNYLWFEKNTKITDKYKK